MDSGNVGRNSGFLSDVVRRNACERARFVSYGSGLACQHAGGGKPRANDECYRNAPLFRCANSGCFRGLTNYCRTSACVRCYPARPSHESRRLPDELIAR
jgi:hypothetical protein